ncbi:MAG: hypothetical protein K9N51_03550 [Candidatus Pacebacteria bacterium]|nr:hypothetical protein [Candidatus Paceibacterota bacterium]
MKPTNMMSEAACARHGQQPHSPQHTQAFSRLARGLVGALTCALTLHAAAAGNTDTPLPSWDSGLSVHYVGEYGGVPWGQPDRPIAPGSRAERVQDLNLSVASINLSDTMSEEFLKRWADLAKWGRQKDKMFLPRVYFWDGRDRFTGSLRDSEVYWRRMDRFLGAMDLNDFYAVCLAEENISRNGRPEILDELYGRIKEKYDVKVYQWYDSAVPAYRIRADGWVINVYSTGGTDFRRHIQQYILVGKPIVNMPYATWKRGEAPWPQWRWDALEGQLEVSREYNLPNAFYWCSGYKGHGGGVHFGMGGNSCIGQINRRIRAWFEEVRALPQDYHGLPSADRAKGDVLELGPTVEDRFEYHDTFSDTHFVNDASIEGFRNLFWPEEHRLVLRSWRGRPPQAALTYSFVGDFTAEAPAANLAVPFLAPGSQVALSISLPGQAAPHRAVTRGTEPQELQVRTEGDPEFADVKQFQVRIEMSGVLTSGAMAVAIDNLSVEAPLIVPAEPSITLKPVPDTSGTLAYEDDFQTQKFRFNTTRKQNDHIEWSRGQIAVRLRPGGSHAELVWHVVSDSPLKNIQVEVDGRANNGSLGTNHYVDVSADGEHWSHAVSTVKLSHNRSGWAYHGLAVDVTDTAAFTGIKDFFVRLRMRTQGYKKLHRYKSGIVNRLRIRAHKETVE